MIRPRDDAGMTLIELLISIAILMLIVGPITMVLQFALATATATSHRTTDSAGAQLLSSYVVADIQSASFVWTPASPTSFSTAPFTTRCGDVNTRLEVQWSDAASSATRAVTYDAVPPPAASPTADTAFARRTWSVTSGSCARTASTTLVDALNTATLPTAVCQPTDCATANSVHLHVDALSQQVHNSSLYKTYSFDLTGSRRSS